MTLIRYRNTVIKSGIILVLLMAAFFPAKYINSIYGYLPGLGLLSFLLVSVLSLLMIQKHIRFETEALDTVCLRGETVNTALKIINGSALTTPKVCVCLSISDANGRENFTCPITFGMYGKSETEFPLNFKMDHIGVYSAGVKTLQIYDPLGIFSITVKGDRKFQVTVLPKTFMMEEIRFDEKQLTESQNLQKSAVSDGFDYTGVREYALGDSMKRIHWKLSAHSSEYMTKVTESSRKSDLTVVVDFMALPFEGETLLNIYDSLVETALSLIEQASGKDVEYSLLFMGRDREINRVIPKGKQDYQDLVHLLPDIFTNLDTDRLDGSEILERERHLSNRSANLILVTARVTDRLVQELIAIKQQRRNPELYHIASADSDRIITGVLDASLAVLDDYDIRYHMIAAEIIVQQ